jgi:hypothetical protein
MKDKKPKREYLTIEGLLPDDKITWKKISCTCSQDPNNITKIYPFAACLHCHAKESEDSLPRVPFDIVQNVHGKLGKTITRHITKIKIEKRDRRTQEILGYSFSS